jgi:superfamily II DNA/RNA helicase
MDLPVGARIIVCTDAAGEGINLQFCWVMANYDVPWNPARIEQRVGRIHRYGQKRSEVFIVNLIAGKTREGKAVKIFLDKLELIRKELKSEKVFDVIGRVFEGKSITLLESRWFRWIAVDTSSPRNASRFDWKSLIASHSTRPVSNVISRRPTTLTTA